MSLRIEGSRRAAIAPRVPTIVVACVVAWRLIGRLAHELLAEQRLARAARGLRALDDRMLADMGLTRRDIEHAVRGGSFDLPRP